MKFPAIISILPLLAGPRSTNGVIPNPLTNGNNTFFSMAAPSLRSYYQSSLYSPSTKVLLHLPFLTPTFSSMTTNMSRPILSTAARRLSRSHSPRTAVSALSPATLPTLSFSASFCDTVSQRSTLRPRFLCPRASTSSPRSVFRFDAFGQRSSFSTTSIRSATKVLQNPRVDEEGKDLLISISPRAAEVR